MCPSHGSVGLFSAMDFYKHFQTPKIKAVHELLWKKGERADGKEYLGVIIGKDRKSGQWITRFKVGVEDKMRGSFCR